VKGITAGRKRVFLTSVQWISFSLQTPKGVALQQWQMRYLVFCLFMHYVMLFQC